MKRSYMSADRAQISRRVTYIGIAWNVFLIVIKFMAGIFAHSSALIADAFHSVSDFGSDFAVLIGVRYSNRPMDRTHHYGHGKIETLTSIIISIMLFFVAAGITVNGCFKIYRFFHGDIITRPGLAALNVALISIIVKEALFRYTHKWGEKIKSNALVANAWHHRTDALSSLAVTAGIAGAYFFQSQFVILDPLAAVLVGIFIFYFVWGSMRSDLNEMLEASLDETINQQILEIAREVPGVKVPHNMKTRKIGNTFAIDMHIKVDPTLSIVEAHDIATRLENILKKNFSEDIFISIHVEPYFDSSHLR